MDMLRRNRALSASPFLIKVLFQLMDVFVFGNDFCCVHFTLGHGHLSGSSIQRGRDVHKQRLSLLFLSVYGSYVLSNNIFPLWLTWRFDKKKNSCKTRRAKIAMHSCRCLTHFVRRQVSCSERLCCSAFTPAKIGDAHLPFYYFTNWLPLLEN